MKAPLVTAIIDTYNYGRYIEEAVNSVLAQNFPAEQIEILVVDDGSTDDTPERLHKYKGRIQHLRKPNGGQASAFNLGFDRAQGEIIALLDADDVWLPEKLERVCETFADNPDAGMVYHRAALWRGKEETFADNNFVPVSGRVPESREAMLRYPMVSTSCLSFRRQALQELLPLPEVLRSQADAFLTALIISVAPVVALPEFLGKYRLHGANLFQMDTESASPHQIEHRMEMRAALLAELEQWLERHGYDLESPNLRDYLKQWTKAHEADGFALCAPSRWEYFLHLFEYPRIYSDIMTRRHRIYGFMRAFAALFLGYSYLYLLDDTRSWYKGQLGKFTRETKSRREVKPATQEANG